MTALTSRRQFLASGTAAVAVLALPAAPPVEALPFPPVVPRSSIPTWIVGTPGEADHEVIRAATREIAVLFRAEECEVVECGDEPFPDCDCGACGARVNYEATRVEQWDGRPEDSITDADWLDAGFDANCARCGDTANRDEDGHNVNGKAVCGDCMKLADWEIVNPEIADEMRAELEPVSLPSLSEGG